MNKHIRFIDLFAGIGGIRKGFEIACNRKGYTSECVFTSEIKQHAVEVLKQNHPDEKIHGDITQIEAKNITDFDFLLAGFPCQAFSSAGKRLGFADTRGTLFFEVERILEAVYQNPKTHNSAASWKRQFLDSYEQHYGERLVIPRWSDIEETYDK